MSQAPHDVPKDDDEIDIFNLLGVVWRGKWLIAVSIVIAALMGYYYSYRMVTPMYPAQVTVALQGEQQQVISDIESVIVGGGTDATAINTQFQVIRSRRLIGQLVDELDLASDPEFNGSLRPPSMRTRFIRLLSGAEAPPPPPLEVVRPRVIDAVVARISVGAIRQSLAFNISTETTNPEKSVLIVNTLAELYIEDQVQQKLEATEQAIGFLSRRTTELEANVEALEERLSQQRERSSGVSPELLEARNLQLRDLRSRIVELSNRISADTNAVAAIEGYQTVDELVTRLQRSDNSQFSLLAQQHRTGRLADDALERAVNNTLDELRQSMERSEQQLSTLQSSERDLAADIRIQSSELIEVQQLVREIEAARLLFETFFTRLQEASVQQGLETADARILSEAVPRGASRPQPRQNILIASILGALLGAGFILLRELRFAGFRTADDLSRSTGHRVLGSIPSLENEDRRAALEHMKTKPNSVFAEAVRNLRTSILMSNIDKEPQIILLTSSVPSEGKTTLSIALTRYLNSMDGKRALLVEADIRRKTLRRYVDEEPKVDLMDVLLGRLPKEEIDLYNDELGLEVLAGSDTGSNAADLFASRRFADLLKALRTEFDYIVIDSPPVLAVPDARVLASYADTVAFVVRWSETTKTQVQQGLEMLDSIDANIAGVVMTQVDQKKMKSYGYAGQYGYDGYSSGYYGS